MKNKKGLIISIAAVVAVIAVFLVVYFTQKPQVHEGTKAYTLEVIDDQGVKKIYTGKTDAENLHGLMDEVAEKNSDFSFSGSDGAYGFFIETVNDITPDYAKDGAYWSIYVNDEYGMYGVDEQTVTDGDIFTIAYEVYDAEELYVEEEVYVGAKAYTLEVIDDQGEKKTYTGKTDAEFLHDLMDEVAEKNSDFSFSGSDGTYGFFIETVNGITPDYSKDGAYWSIYVNGEYGMYGADEQTVADGDTFTIAYEVYVAE